VVTPPLFLRWRALICDHPSLCAAQPRLQILQSAAATVLALVAGQLISSGLLVLSLAGVVWLLR
jgi:hypothetical protein